MLDGFLDVIPVGKLNPPCRPEDEKGENRIIIKIINDFILFRFIIY